MGTKQHGSRGPPQDDEKHQARGAAANEDMDEDVTYLISQVHMKLSVQLESRVRDSESATYCTLSVLRDKGIVITMQDADRADNDNVVHTPDEDRESSHIWFCMAMLSIRRGNRRQWS